MKLQVIGLSHHTVSLKQRERLALNTDQVCSALAQFRERFPAAEVAMLSTCNRVEVYTAAEDASNSPTHGDVVQFLADFHHLDASELADDLLEQTGQDAVRHLFTVASSLDSMVVGEPQILAQVKEAYQLATRQNHTVPLMHAAFQTASKVARRVASETAIHHRRVSIPSVAVADFAQQIFERFDDKTTLVIGAGEMAEETLRYLKDQGARDVTVVNRNAERAAELARRWHGRALGWERLPEALATADLVISTTGAEQPVITREQFGTIEASRDRRPLFILDLAVPRDFDPAIGDRPDVYLYSIDDLRQACDRNRRRRDKELPAAERIIEQETAGFMADLHHRATSPVIRRLKKGWQKPKEEELQRLLHKLPELDERARAEIRQSFDRLLNKLMHPPLESLRDESRQGVPGTLVDALSRLFRLKD